MINREQIRARNALKEGIKSKGSGEEGGDALSGFPALVMNNGLLATLAFSEQKKGGYIAICKAIEAHLKEIGLVPANTALLAHLTESDSATLRLCTAEALAYLNYLRRFGKK